jgi:hypothetical protein
MFRECIRRPRAEPRRDGNLKRVRANELWGGQPEHLRYSTAGRGCLAAHVRTRQRPLAANPCIVHRQSTYRIVPRGGIRQRSLPLRGIRNNAPLIQSMEAGLCGGSRCPARPVVPADKRPKRCMTERFVWRSPIELGCPSQRHRRTLMPLLEGSEADATQRPFPTHAVQLLDISPFRSPIQCYIEPSSLSRESSSSDRVGPKSSCRLSSF